MSWLFEGHLSVYLLLSTAGLVLLAAWWNRRQRRFLIGLGVVAGLAVLYGLLDLGVESDLENLEFKVTEMAAGVTARDLPRTFSHISEQFRLGSRGKQELRTRAETASSRGEIRAIRVWDFELVDVSRPNHEATVSFYVKVEGNYSRGEYYLVHSQFVLESDGQWRLKTFDLRNPVVDTNQPIALPF